MNSYLKKYFRNFDAILVSSHGNIVYLTGYGGFSDVEREVFLLLTENKNFLITDKRYAEAVKKQVLNFQVIDSGAIETISRDYSGLLKNLRTKVIGIEENNLTVSEFKKLKKHIKNIKNVDLSNLRMIKKDEEIKNIKQACKIGDLTFKFIIGKLKTGVSERQIANLLEFFIKKNGADFSFAPIVAFGKNSSAPHHLSGQTKLKKNQIVLLDFGVKINNYCSDMSRTVFFGSASAEFKRTHRVVLAAQTKAIEFLKSSIINHKSITGKQIDAVARNFIKSNGYPNIIHSVGHGVGIEVHESPHLSPHSIDKIEQGMVFSVEPGIYIPNYGGVRIEDLVLVTKNGAELLSHANRDLIEI